MARQKWDHIRQNGRGVSRMQPPFDFIEEEDDGDEEEGPPKYEASELETLRKTLFKNGSDFKPTTRDQIVGIENVLLEIDGLIHWLKNSAIYSSLGARLEPGVLFSGVPGSGKTLVARYIASESEALFINVRDFPHNNSFFHDSDIAALFNLARQTYVRTKKPIILFWDEFEGGAKERSRDGVSVDQAAAISQLTAELDGIHGKNEGVLLIGCTNYDYMIDDALLRPGRMGLHIEFNAPDREGKEQLLGFYLDKITTTGPIDLEILSYFFDDCDTAAAIEEAVNEGWRVAVMNTIHKIEAGKGNFTDLQKTGISLNEHDLIDVFLNRLIGPPPTFINLMDENLFAIAVHETGHALAALIWNIPLRLVTVRPGKKALGKTFTAKIDMILGKIEEQQSQLRVGIGGLVAEEISGVGKGIGSWGDTEALTKVASSLVDIHGIGKLSGLFNTNGFGERWDISPRISPFLLEQKDRDMIEELQVAQRDVEIAFRNIGRDNIRAIAENLAQVQTMTGEQFAAVVSQILGDPTQYKR